jgi:SAM-dependent methyltransferase
VVAALAPGGIDLIVLNSVAQYLKRPELDALLALFRRLLAPGGILVVGDVIPPHTSAVTEIVALMRLAWRNGFIVPAFVGLVRTLFSDYRRLRAQLGLSTYTEAEMTAVLNAAGYRAQRRMPNIEHNQQRMTFVAAPA